MCGGEALAGCDCDTISYRSLILLSKSSTEGAQTLEWAETATEMRQLRVPRVANKAGGVYCLGQLLTS